MSTSSQILLAAATAAGIGFIHSLSPGHWLPVVLVVKARKWKVPQALLGAFVAASGHILLSVGLAWIALKIGLQALVDDPELLESRAFLLMILFGAAYAIYSWRTHSHCEEHAHHGPEPKAKKAPWIFLFSVGFTPCVAVLPVIMGAGALGGVGISAAAIGFALGVVTAFGGAVILVSKGVLSLDHPLLEHYGDVVTGIAVMVLGAFLFFLHG